MNSTLLGWKQTGWWQMAIQQPKTYFEQVPVEVVKKIARELPDHLEIAEDAIAARRKAKPRPARTDRYEPARKGV